MFSHYYPHPPFNQTLYMGGVEATYGKIFVIYQLLFKTITMTNKQLLIFKDINIKKLDSVLFDYHNFIYAMKSLAFILDSHIGQGPSFNRALEAAKLASRVVLGMEDISFKYSGITAEALNKILVYNPYYVPQEPRSRDSLIESIRRYEVSSKELLMRLETVCKNSGIRVPAEASQLPALLNQIALIIKHESI